MKEQAEVGDAAAVISSFQICYISSLLKVLLLKELSHYVFPYCQAKGIVTNNEMHLHGYRK